MASGIQGDRGGSRQRSKKENYHAEWISATGAKTAVCRADERTTEGSCEPGAILATATRQDVRRVDPDRSRIPICPECIIVVRQIVTDIRETVEAIV